MKIITFANTKGGSGKSTLLTNLAICLVNQKMNVILMDLDPQKTLELWWEQRKEDQPTLTDIKINNLSNKLDKMRAKNFDFLLIDTPGHISEQSVEAIKLSDLVIIPCKPTAADFRAVGSIISIIKKEAKDFIFILNQCIPRNSFVAEAMSRLSKFGKIAPCYITNRVAYATAMHKGISAANIDKAADIEISKICNFLEEIFKPEEAYVKKNKTKL